MRKALSIAFVAALLAALPSAAHADTPRWGKVKVSCPATGQIDAVDPIGSPGQATSPHKHVFSCARNITPTTSLGDLLNGSSTGLFPGDNSGVWFPAMMKNGVAYGASTSYYLAAVGADPALIAGHRVSTPPNGLVILMGDPNSTTLQSTNYSRWRCNESGSEVYSSLAEISAYCGTYFYLEIDAPNCWDGKRLDSPNHRDHMAYGGAGCPASHPVRIPQIQIAQAYEQAALGGRLSSDAPGAPPGSSLHGDYIFAFTGTELEQAMRCINDPGRNTPNVPSCGTFTYDGPADWNPNLPLNPWKIAVQKWANSIGFVYPSGDPNYNGPPAGTP